jgi:DNA polymerase-3 subunit epsilon
VIESRLIARLLPRYNRAGTRVDRYCYVRLDVDTPWPRLSVVKNPSTTGLHLGPLPSRTMANLVIEAIQSAVPLRRCSARLGRNFTPAADATACSAAQLGVAQCPCAGTADAAEYARAVEHAAAALSGHPHRVVELLHDKMMQLAHQQRFEEAAGVRDRLTALVGAAKRFHLVAALRSAGRVEVTYGESTWTIERAQLIDAVKSASVSRALPVAAPEISGTGVLSRHQIDEALCLARFCDKRAAQLTVQCSGEWTFPISDRLPQLPGLATP